MKARRVVATIEMDTDAKLSEVKRTLGNGAWPQGATPLQVQVNLIRVKTRKR